MADTDISKADGSLHSPRRRAWVGILLLLAAVAFAGTLPVLPQLAVLVSAGLGFGVYRLRQTCPSCGTSVARSPVGALRIYTPLPPKECRGCGRDLR